MSWWVYLEDRDAPPTCSYGFDPERYARERAEGHHRFDLDDGPCPSPCFPTVSVERHAEGGTYAVGGTDEAEVNVTYNYGGLFREAFDGLGFEEALSGKRAAEVIPLLERGVERLGTARTSDYWEASPGNAGHALSILLGWARQHPNAVFRVS